jgi:hypothetical protein
MEMITEENLGEFLTYYEGTTLNGIIKRAFESIEGIAWKGG